MAGNAVVSTLQHTWKMLTDHNVRAALMGGLAVGAWRHARATRDVDLLVSVDPPEPDQLLRWAQEAGFQPKRLPALVEIPPHRFYQLLYTPKILPIDIQVDFLLADTEHLRNVLARASTTNVPSFGSNVNVVSCEDLILLKLSADRILDRMDVRYLLEYNRDTIDFPYLVKWINRLQLQDVWKEWWNQAFPGESPPTV